MESDDSGTTEIAQGLCFNGINGETGNYLLPSLTAREMAKIAASEFLDSDEIEDLRRRWIRANEAHFAPVARVDAQDLSKAGWGVIFASDVTEAEKEALYPLLKLHKKEAGDLYQDFPGQKAYRANDTKYSFLGRSGRVRDQQIRRVFLITYF